MTDELDKALEWAAGIVLETCIAETRHNLSTLAAAVRSLRETVKAREEEIERLKAGKPNYYGGWIEYLGVGSYKLHIEPPVNPSLDQALNEGDGSYKP